MAGSATALPDIKTISVRAYGGHPFVTGLGNPFAIGEIASPAKTVTRSGKLDDF